MKKIITILSLLTSLGFSFALTNITNFHSIGTTNISAGDYGVKFVANKNTSITSVSTANNTQATAVKILNSSFTTIGTATITDHTANFSTPVEIISGLTYYALINNGGSSFLTDYGNTYGDLPYNNTDINFPSDSGAVFKTPYNEGVTSLSTGGGNQLGITSIETGTTTATTTPTSDAKILFVGDSLTEGLAVTNPYPSLITSTGFAKVNMGVSSKTILTINAEKTTVTDVALGQNKTDDIIVVWAGTNDLWAFSVGDVNGTYNKLVQYCMHERSLGAKVIVLTMVSRTNNVYVTGETTRNQYNALIRANWSTFADGIADVGANQYLGDDGDYANTTYFADGAHLTQTGYQVVASVVQPVLDSVISGVPITPPTLTKVQRLFNAGFTQAQVDILLEIFQQN